MGTANQLLAALALLALTIWLKSLGRHYAFLKWPTIFMFLVTFSALILLIKKHLLAGHYFLVVLAAFLLGLALYIAWAGFRPRVSHPKGSYGAGSGSEPSGDLLESRKPKGKV